MVVKIIEIKQNYFNYMTPQPDWDRIYREAKNMLDMWLYFHYKEYKHAGPPRAVLHLHEEKWKKKYFEHYYIEDLERIVKFLRSHGSIIKKDKVNKRLAHNITKEFIRINRLQNERNNIRKSDR